ncbi:MAG: hypothetical protein ACKV2Q_24525 [Planctomycetaceae bacterium]
MRTLQIRWRLLALIAILVGAWLVPSVGHAQTKEPEKSAQPVREQAIPLAVLSVAGFERWMSNVDYLFGSIEREELSDYVGGKLANVNDFKGFDKDKPFGMLIFLRPGLLPQPYPVTFVPVKHLADAIGTVSSGPFKVKKVDDTHYDLIAGNQTFYARLAGDYAWIATQADQLDYDFPDPLTITKRLADRYDVAIEFNLTQVPEGMKHIFLDFLRASTETAIQQRDGEPNTAYQLRRLNALDTLDWLDQLLLQGERLTLGAKVDPKSKYATIELDVLAKRDSAFAKSLQDVAARPSYFANVVEDDVPLTFSLSAMMTPQNQKRFAEFFEEAEQDIAGRLANVLEGKPAIEAKKPENAAPPPADAPKATGLPKSKRGSSGKPPKAKIPVPPALHDVFESLRATAKTGHVDFFVQFIADSKSDGAPQFTLLGGAKIADGTKFASGATEILRQLKDRPGMARMDFGIDTHAGVTFHRIAGGGLDSDPGAQETFGSKPAVYVGVGSQAVWFALGQPDALSQLKLVIDRVNTEPVARPDKRDFIPFQFHMHMKKWIELGTANSEKQLQRIEKTISEQEAAAKAAEAEAKAAAGNAGANPTGAEPKAGEGNAPQRGPRRGGPQGFGRQTPEQRREGLATWNAMQKKAFSGSDDKLRIDFKPTDQGARIRLQFDESFLRLLGLGVSRAIDGNIEAERKAAEKQQENAKPKK